MGNALPVSNEGKSSSGRRSFGKTARAWTYGLLTALPASFQGIRQNLYGLFTFFGIEMESGL
jgi:hypothetical protein